MGICRIYMASIAIDIIIPNEISKDVATLARSRLWHSSFNLNKKIVVQQWFTLLDQMGNNDIMIPTTIMADILTLVQQQLWLSGLKIDKKLAIQCWLCRQSDYSCNGTGQQNLFDFSGAG